MIADLLTVAVLALVGVRLVSSARVAVTAGARRYAAVIVRGIRWRHVLQAPLALTAVSVTAVLLFAVPVLRIGWWSAIGGTGSIVTGGTEQTGGTPLAGAIPPALLLLPPPGPAPFARPG